MLYSGKKIRASRDNKNKYSNSRVVRKKISEPSKKAYPPPPPPPPFQVKWSVPYQFTKKKNNNKFDISKEFIQYLIFLCAIVSSCGLYFTLHYTQFSFKTL